MDEDWEAKSAADTLQRAEEIKQNRKLYSRALKYIRQSQSAAENVLKTAGSLARHAIK